MSLRREAEGMDIPSYETLMLPLLRSVSDSQVYQFSDVVAFLAEELKVSKAELQKLLPSGRYPVFRSRVGWAKTYLTKAKLIELPSRGSLKITQRGIEALGKKLKRIDGEFLRHYPEFLEFQGRKREEQAAISGQAEQTPTELLEFAFAEIKKSLAQELLEQVKRISPQFFEGLVIDLLIAMGYGGNLKNAGEVTGKSGDGGIDGIINEDVLGLSKIYVQAKRWTGNSPVSSPDMQKFVGSLAKRHASKGVFLTTARFSDGAREFVKGLNSTIVLIDGDELVKLMIRYNVGVATKEIYEIKRIDSDYFAEE
jgi:restriction system protein